VAVGVGGQAPGQGVAVAVGVGVDDVDVAVNVAVGVNVDVGVVAVSGSKSYVVSTPEKPIVNLSTFASNTSAESEDDTLNKRPPEPSSALTIVAFGANAM
jgi:hypothetical protein